MNPKLNAVYHMDSSVQVGSRATYWDEQRRFFMYYQAWLVLAQATAEDFGENKLRGKIQGGLSKENGGLNKEMMVKLYYKNGGFTHELGG